jgi:hypothetical protein
MSRSGRLTVVFALVGIVLASPGAAQPQPRADLLDFRSVGDKWQIVHGWLRDRLED